jgi:molecular chaperone DnaJ
MDYYSTLGVNKDASQDEIKRAYRSAAMKHHPDRGGDTNKFKEIEEAYRTLGDEQKRAEYDQPTAQGFNHFAGGMPPGFEAFFGHQFSDLFRPQRPRNRDLNFHTRISLEDAFYGREIMVSFFKQNGQEKTLNVKIPAGIQSGMTVRLSGVGDDTLPGAPAGDILIRVEIIGHAEFKREGDDLIKDVEISCIGALLGQEVNIRTIDGKNFVGTIPAGSQPDSILAIANQGMPNMNNPNSRGRLLLNLKMFMPSVTEQQKQELRKIFL